MPIDVARGLREDLASAIEEEEAKVATPEPVETPEPTVEPETPPETTEATDGRLRGPDGKFVAKDKAIEEAEKPAEPAKEIRTAPTEAAAKPGEPKPSPTPKATVDPIAAATARWTANDKAMLAKLPAEAQQFIARRHSEMVGDYERKTEALATFRKEYEPVDQMFAPFRQQMQSQGFTAGTLIQAWANVEKQLIDGKGVDVVAKIVKDYRVDPAAVAAALGLNQATAAVQPKPNGQADGAAIQLDPDVSNLLQAHLSKMLEPLQKQLGELNGFTQAQKDAEARRQQAELNRQTQAANQELQTFIDAAGKDGQPLHPHYAEVVDVMIALAQRVHAAGQKPDLESIYDQAVYATPSTREKLLAAQTAAQEATQRAEARAKATAARSAAVSVTGAPTGGPAPRARKEPASIRDALLEAAAEHEDAA